MRWNCSKKRSRLPVLHATSNTCCTSIEWKNNPECPLETQICSQHKSQIICSNKLQIRPVLLLSIHFRHLDKIKRKQSIYFSFNKLKLEPVNFLNRLFSEAFAMNDRSPGLVIFALRDPHLLERRKRSKNGATDPDRVLAFRRSDNLDFHSRRR